MKKRILFVGEASYLSSGFGNYARELLKRLHQNPNFEIAEFAAYSRMKDKRIHQVPWRFYCNEVEENDPRIEEFRSNPLNTFGAWRFERVLLDFKPDCVLIVADPYTHSFIHRSPLRDFFSLINSPTSDSFPYQPQWLEEIRNSESVIGYTQWGLDEFKKAIPDTNFFAEASPGVDLDIFRPMNKKQVRQAFGLNPNDIIIGKVARNQARKLYPQLFKVFRNVLDKLPQDLAERTKLYCHLSWPDAGFDIPRFLLEYKLSNKVLFTYMDKETKQPFISLFQDSRCYSPFTNGPNGVIPSVSRGITSEQLAAIFNCFDLYIQYATAEGLGISAVEAAACGIPVAAHNLTAMSEVVERTGGFPINTKTNFTDIGTQSDRGYPDNEHAVQIIVDFIKSDESYRSQKSKESRRGAEKWYSWDRCGSIWTEAIMSCPPPKRPWNDQIKIHNYPKQIPQNLTNQQLIHFLYSQILNEPNKINSWEAMNYLKELNQQYRRQGPKVKQILPTAIIEDFVARINNRNHAEMARTGQLQMFSEDYIDFANKRMMS